MTLAPDPESDQGVPLEPPVVLAADASPVPAAESPIPGEPEVTPDLAQSAQGLAPRFPLDRRGTGLVLYDSAPGELRASWSLEPHDRERFAGSFPEGGERPVPVLRLRRSLPEGGTELVEEVSLMRVARERVGEVGFRLGPDLCRYHAELGLAAGDRGWLMLARSNGLDNTVGVGPRLTIPGDARSLPGMVPVPIAEPVPAPPPDAQARLSGAPGTWAAPDRMAPLSSGASPAARVVQPQDPSLADLTLHPIGALSPVVAEQGPGLVPSFPVAVPAGDGPLSMLPGRGLSLAESAAVGVASRGPMTPESADDAGATVAPHPIQPTSVVRTPRPDPESAPGPAAGSSAIFAPIDPPAYGVPPAWMGGLTVSAELRIVGQAVPGSLVDLFGYPFRVGPGGRFQLTVRVDNPELLRRALEHNPPPELKALRGDEP